MKPKRSPFYDGWHTPFDKGYGYDPINPAMPSQGGEGEKKQEPNVTRFCPMCTVVGLYSELEEGEDFCPSCRRQIESASRAWPTDLK